MAALQKFYPISDTDRKTINANYNKNQSDIDSDVLILREWLKKQPHIPEIKDDSFLEIMLLRNKFRMEKTKLKIDKYFSVKTAYADIFLKVDPFDTDVMFVDSYVKECVMPQLAPNGSRIFFLTLEPLKHDKDFRSMALFKYMLLRMENHLILDYTDSVIMVLNAENVSISLVPKVQVSDIAKLLNIFFEGYSARISSIHVLNMHPVIDTLLSMTKPLLPAKIKSRINLYQKGSTQIFDTVPKECLPLEVGGTGPSIEKLSSDYSKTVQVERDYITTRNKWCSDEKLRVGSPTIQMDMFGVDGTFKNISID